MKPQFCKDCKHVHDKAGHVAWPKECHVYSRTNYVSGYETNAYCDDIRDGPTCEKYQKKEEA